MLPISSQSSTNIFSIISIAMLAIILLLVFSAIKFMAQLLSRAKNIIR